MAEWARLRSYVLVLLKAISLPLPKCTHLSSHVPPWGRMCTRLVVTIYVDSRLEYG